MEKRLLYLAWKHWYLILVGTLTWILGSCESIFILGNHNMMNEFVIWDHLPSIDLSKIFKKRFCDSCLIACPCNAAKGTCDSLWMAWCSVSRQPPRDKREKERELQVGASHISKGYVVFFYPQKKKERHYWTYTHLLLFIVVLSCLYRGIMIVASFWTFPSAHVQSHCWIYIYTHTYIYSRFLSLSSTSLPLLLSLLLSSPSWIRKRLRMKKLLWPLFSWSFPSCPLLSMLWMH